MIAKITSAVKDRIPILDREALQIAAAWASIASLLFPALNALHANWGGH